MPQVCDTWEHNIADLYIFLEVSARAQCRQLQGSHTKLLLKMRLCCKKMPQLWAAIKNRKAENTIQALNARCLDRGWYDGVKASHVEARRHKLV